MNLELLLRIAGFGLIVLAALHVPIGRHLRWAEDAERMTPTNRSIFRVHVFFICLVLVLMGLPCAIVPEIFLELSRMGCWVTWSITAFWAIRLYFQWLVYPTDLWRGKRMETAIHWCFSVIWLGLTLLFAICGLVQLRLVDVSDANF